MKNPGPNNDSKGTDVQNKSVALDVCCKIKRLWPQGSGRHATKWKSSVGMIATGVNPNNTSYFRLVFVRGDSEDDAVQKWSVPI